MRRAHDLAGSPFGERVPQDRHTHVGDVDDAFFVEEQIARLQIAMHGLRGVNRRNAATRAFENVERAVEIRQSARRPFANPFFDGLTDDDLRDEVGRTFVLAECVDRQDVRMRDPRHGSRLGEKSSAEIVGEQLGANELDGYVALELLIASPKHDTHSATPESSGDSIDATDESAGAEPERARKRRRGRTSR